MATARRNGYCPMNPIDRIEIVAKGAVRRAKLYYLRERAGRAARVTEEA